MEKIVIDNMDFLASIPHNQNEKIKINELLAEGWQIQQMEQAIITSAGRNVGSGQTVTNVVLTFWLKKG